MDDNELLPAREVSERTGRSRSQIHRDANAGKLPVAQEFPGYHGARLFRWADVRETYGIAA
jgi:predicted DNA-binding transcriptional regulator AlpA